MFKIDLKQVWYSIRPIVFFFMVLGLVVAAIFTTIGQYLLMGAIVIATLSLLVLVTVGQTYDRWQAYEKRKTRVDKFTIK